MEERDRPITIRLTKEEIAAIDAAAKRQRRDRSSYIRNVLLAHIEKSEEQ